LLRGGRLLELDACRRVAHDQDLGVSEPERVDDRTQVVDRRGAVRLRHLPLRTALELDPEVQAPRRERDDRDQDERTGEDQPAPRVRDELEVRALVVEVGDGVAPATGTGEVGARGWRRDGGHATTPGASRPAAMPTPRMRTRCGCRDMMTTSGYITK